jgi:hypothetical protein
MGATEFCTVGTGTTAAKAFAALKRDAWLDHGHCGYTGTIAEKETFAMVAVDRVAECYVAKLATMCTTVAAQRKLQKELVDTRPLGGGDWDTYYRLEKQVVYQARLEDGGRETLAQAVARVNKGYRKLSKALQSMRPTTRAKAVAECMQRFDHPDTQDKWGPACCVQVGAREWMFFGLASE